MPCTLSISGSEGAGKQFATLETRGELEPKCVLQFFWDRYWKRAGQLLASFFFLLVPCNSLRSKLGPLIFNWCQPVRRDLRKLNTQSPQISPGYTYTQVFTTNAENCYHTEMQSETMQEQDMSSYRAHFLWVYRRDNPHGMLGEHEKSL